MFPLLTTLVFLPTVGALATMVAPRSSVRWVAATFSAVTFVLSLWLYFGPIFSNGSTTGFGDIMHPAWSENVQWIHFTIGQLQLNINYHLGADGLSIFMLILNALLTFLAEAVERVERALRGAGVRVKSDWRDYKPGYKYNDWELRGVPLRVEIGPRDVQNNQVMVVRRDTRAKEAVSIDGLHTRVGELLGEIQQGLYDAALKFRESRTYQVSEYGEFQARMADRATLGFVEAWWCGDAACEAQVKTETQATIRNLPFDRPAADASARCVHCGQPATEWAIFAKAY